MKDPRNLSKDQLVKIVQSIRDWFWLTEDAADWVEETYGKKFLDECLKRKNPKDPNLYPEYYSPAKEWGPEIVEGAAQVLIDAGLAPDRVLPVGAGYPKQTSKAKKEQKKEKGS